MPVPKEVVGWLDEEEEALAHHNLLILNYKIFGRLQQQNSQEAVVAEVTRSLAPLDFLAHGKKPHLGALSSRPRVKLIPHRGSRSIQRLPI